MSTVCYIGFGANLGDPLRKLEEAIVELNLLRGSRVLNRSGIYETDPIGLVDEGSSFINAVIEIETDSDAMTLITWMRNIEKKLGKSTSHRSDLSRIIDLDLLFFGQEIIDTETLTVPHPRLTGRAFVLGPMAELAPNFKHPAEGKSMRTLLEILGPDELAKIRLIRGN